MGFLCLLAIATSPRSAATYYELPRSRVIRDVGGGSHEAATSQTSALTTLSLLSLLAANRSPSASIYNISFFPEVAIFGSAAHGSRPAAARPADGSWLSRTFSAVRGREIMPFLPVYRPSDVPGCRQHVEPERPGSAPADSWPRGGYCQPPQGVGVSTVLDSRASSREMCGGRADYA